MSKIALIGLGLVGRAWAVSFARAGHEVAIWDERPEAIEPPPPPMPVVGILLFPCPLACP